MPPKKLKAKDIIKDLDLESDSDGSGSESYSGSYESGSYETDPWDDSDSDNTSKNTQNPPKTKKTPNVQTLKKLTVAQKKKLMDGDDIEDSDLKGKDVIKKMMKATPVKNPIVKKGPGRPRKIPALPKIPRLGIVDKALHNKNMMEMQYDSPQSIKKIFALLKSMNCKNIYFTFHSKGILIQTIDHLEKSTISIQCNGQRFNRYYCEKIYIVKFDQTILSSLFDQLTTNIHELKIISKKNQKESSIFVMFVNRVLESPSIYEIPVVFVDKVPESINKKNIKYPLRFTLSSREFKTIVKNMERCKAEKFLIQKDGKKDLRITHSRKNKNVSTIGFRQQFKNPDKIQLHSNLSDREIFSAPISVKFIKKFANSTLADNVTIHAHAKEPTLFVSELDIDDTEIKKGKIISLATFIIEVRTDTFEYQTIK